MSLEDILKKTNTKLEKKVKSKPFSFGADKPSLGSEEGSGDVSLWVPTGIWPLDCALGGGLAMGRVTELFSDDEGEGKTTLTVQIEEQVQRVGGTVVHFESESALDKIRCAGIGLDLNNMIKWTPDTLEDGFRYMGELIKQIAADKDQSDKPTIICWDTISMARTESERDGDAFAKGMISGPRQISTALKNYAQEIAAHNVHLLLVNQSYTDINNPKAKYLGTQYKTHGGKRIGFASSYRIKVKKVGYIGRGRNLDIGDDKLGIKVRVTIPKNKLARPFRSVDCYLYGDTGYNSNMTMAHNFMEKGPYQWKEGLDHVGSGRYKPIGCEKSYYWHELDKAISENEETQRLWKLRWLEYFPIHPSRVQNLQGWYERDFTVSDISPTPGGILK